MPKEMLPLLPEGATQISSMMSVHNKSDNWVYFCGPTPVFTHPATDTNSFRMFTSQLYCEGRCSQSDIVRAFAVTSNSVKRSVKKYRDGGINAFYTTPARRGGGIITDKTRPEIQILLDEGLSRSEVCKKLDIKKSTLDKAIQQGRLHESNSNKHRQSNFNSNKSSRSSDDAKVSERLGVACTRPLERVLAATGRLPGGAPTIFEHCKDVSFGGVLCALPALSANGLFKHLSQCFSLPPGYYNSLHIILLMAYMALARIKNAEQLRYEAPGELGKLLGLDRIPEARCLREKMDLLSRDDCPEKWAAMLSKDWLEKDTEAAGALYIDGHVRVYNGSKTDLPKRYISRQRLCLRGTTDYWVNDSVGRPFFVIERTIDDGLLNVLRADIVPRLLIEVPEQPDSETLEKNPFLHRFILVFDREGYSPAFFREMWEEHRIACLSYKKFPSDSWPKEWFSDTVLNMPNGETIIVKLAEMGTRIGSTKDGIWMREVKKLSERGHQTSIVTSAYSHLPNENAALMFSRWSQENFFRYMMENYGIDALCEYAQKNIPETNQVINPRWRELNSKCRSLTSQLQRQRAVWGARKMHPEEDEKKKEKWLRDMAELTDHIEQLENQLDQNKEDRKAESKHIQVSDLPEDKKFQQLSPHRKRLKDCVSMIAYRAETAMAALLRPILGRHMDARPLLREIFRSAVDLIPDTNKGVLNVCLHHMANPQANKAVKNLLEHLNESELCFPGTDLKLVYSLGNLE